MPRIKRKAAMVSIDDDSNINLAPGPSKVVKVGTTVQFTNGLQFVSLATAITANSTATTAPVGSLGITSHATGRGKLFVSDGTLWQFVAVA